MPSNSDDPVTMNDYLPDDREDHDPTVSVSYPDYPYDRNKNDQWGTPQRCRWCGEDFPTSGRRNHLLNRHKSECDERPTRGGEGDA